MVIDDDVFTGTVSASTPLSTTSIGAKSSFSRPAVEKVVDQFELFNHFHGVPKIAAICSLLLKETKNLSLSKKYNPKN